MLLEVYVDIVTLQTMGQSFYQAFKTSDSHEVTLQYGKLSSRSNLSKHDAGKALCSEKGV